MALLSPVTIGEDFLNILEHLIGTSSCLAWGGEDIHLNDFQTNRFFQPPRSSTPHQFWGVYKYFSMEMIFVLCTRIAESLHQQRIKLLLLDGLFVNSIEQLTRGNGLECNAIELPIYIAHAICFTARILESLAPNVQASNNGHIY